MSERGVLLICMIFLSALEILVPFKDRRAGRNGRLRTNLTLTAITFGLNAVMNAVIVSVLAAGYTANFGLFSQADFLGVSIAIMIALDFVFYVTHVAMHKSSALWRFHRVHHADTMVDATTAFRQHPVEGVFRYGAIGAAAALLGASPAVFAVYRLLSAVNAILEHANIAAPLWLDRLMSIVTSWPHFHKIHHSRDPQETDSNYGNLLSVWDRIFRTFTSVERARGVSYGLGSGEALVADSVIGNLGGPFLWQR